MGLTTSREAIGRQASSIKVDPEEANGAHDGDDDFFSTSNAEAVTGMPGGVGNGSTFPASSPANAKKRKCDHDDEQQPRSPKQRKKPKKKAGPKKISSKNKTAAVKSEVAGGGGGGGGGGGLSEAGVVKVNPHRAKILVAKQALAAIKEGTRIYIKSGEGNGGDTWWDSGVIQKIHERGKPYEVEWERINNRGEEVDTGVEKRIILPVTYSLAGVAAEALKREAPDESAAALVRKRVLFEARIGSWCIRHPEEPWGMLDPFGEDCNIPKPAMPSL